MGVVVSYSRLIMSKLEQYIVTYTPFRIVLYDTLILKQKFNIFTRLIRTKTSFG
jgi:hypothetical protein